MLWWWFAAKPAAPSADDGSESWAKKNLGIVIGVPVGVIGLAGIIGVVYVRHRRNQSSNQERPRGAVPLADQDDAGAAVVPIAEPPSNVVRSGAAIN